MGWAGTTQIYVVGCLCFYHLLSEIQDPPFRSKAPELKGTKVSCLQGSRKLVSGPTLEFLIPEGCGAGRYTHTFIASSQTLPTTTDGGEKPYGRMTLGQPFLEENLAVFLLSKAV